MTDPQPTPAEEETVRALLRDARHTGPTPEHVVARLDARLAELAAERSLDRDAEASVVPLAPRRRHRAATLLVAAAAAVAAGVGIGQVLPDLTSSSEDSTAGGAFEEASEDAGLRESPTEAGEGEPAAPEANTFSGLPEAQDRTARRRLPRLTSEQPLEPQAQRLLDRPAAEAAGDGYVANACAPTTVPGRRVPVTYDGDPGVMLVRDVSESRTRVTVWVCGSTAPSASATIVR